jgi:hypothetical protein
MENSTKTAIEEPVWKTKDGRVIPISQMGDIHVLNAEAFLRRKHRELLDTSPPPGFIGEVADWLANQDWLALQNSDVSDVYPIYESILTEIKKRNLSHLMETFHEAKK